MLRRIAATSHFHGVLAVGGADPADEWRRGSRNYLEAKRGLREVLPSVHARDIRVHIKPLL